MKAFKTVFVFTLFGFAVWLYLYRKPPAPIGAAEEEPPVAASARAGKAQSQSPDDPGEAAPAPAVFQNKPKLALIPFWNYSGADYESLSGSVTIGQLIVRGLAASTSRLAAHKEYEIIVPEEVGRVFEKDLSPKDRETWNSLRDARNLEGVKPLLESLMRGLKAQTLVFGTFEKIGGGDLFQGAVRVQYLVLNKPPEREGETEETIHEFRGAIPGSMQKLCESLAQDGFWDGDSMKYLWRVGELNPPDWKKKLLDLPFKVNADRLDVALEALKGETLPSSQCWMSKDDMNKAALATDQLLQIPSQKTNPRAQNLRAMVEFCGSNRPAAELRLREAIRLDPNFHEAQYNLAYIDVEKWWENKYPPDLDEAYRALTQAIQAKKDFSAAWALRGVVNAERGILAEAQTDSNNAYLGNQKNPMIYLGRALVAMKRRDDYDTLAQLNKAAEYDPTNALVQKLRGDFSVKRRDTYAAIQAYSAAAKAKPLYFDARIALVDVLVKERRFKEAQDQCQGMIALNRKHSVPHYKLGEICEQQRDFLCAEQEYLEVQKLDPSWPTIQAAVERARKSRGGYTSSPQYEQFRRALDGAQSPPASGPLAAGPAPIPHAGAAR